MIQIIWKKDQNSHRKTTTFFIIQIFFLLKFFLLNLTILQKNNIFIHFYINVLRNIFEVLQYHLSYLLNILDIQKNLHKQQMVKIFLCNEALSIYPYSLYVIIY